MVKIKLQLDAKQIGCLLGCMDAIINLGYAGNNEMLMHEIVVDIETQIKSLTR